MAKCIMIQGTMSNVGKSAIAAGLCRVFKQDGYKVAPFKSQNMALNSFITQNGLEMGRAQVMQAEAAGIEPEVSMNPILLKPTNDTGSQVIINGKPIGVMSAVEYYRHKRDYIPYILEAYRELEKKYDVIVINFANPDMVGHTGVQAAAIKAVEAVDECVGKAVEALKEVDGQMFICADHGNAEQLIDEETGERDEKSLKRQADRYQEMFELLKKMDTVSGGPCNITSVTVFGICDDYPLYDDLVQCLYLWDKNAKPKESFYRVREVGESN